MKNDDNTFEQFMKTREIASQAFVNGLARSSLCLV
jgi:hypothetical protein